jgi:hypothetical protein
MCREAVKLFKFLLSPYNLIGACKSGRTALFITTQEHFTAYCKSSEAVKLVRFLLPPYSLTETYNVQKCSVRWPADLMGESHINVSF